MCLVGEWVCPVGEKACLVGEWVCPVGERVCSG